MRICGSIGRGTLSLVSGPSSERLAARLQGARASRSSGTSSGSSSSSDSEDSGGGGLMGSAAGWPSRPGAMAGPAALGQSSREASSVETFLAHCPVDPEAGDPHVMSGRYRVEGSIGRGALHCDPCKCTRSRRRTTHIAA